MKGRANYGAKKVTINGITFHSKKEGERYLFLLSMVECGQITELELQPNFILVSSFTLDGKKIRPLTYSADFRYKNISGEKIIEDIKASKFFMTDVYKIKIKMFKFIYCFKQGLKFYEVFDANDTSMFY